jgi:hypothetical protein
MFTPCPEAEMKKLTLDVDTVCVESFAAGSAPAVRGTVDARQEMAATPVCSGTTCILQCLTVQPRCF